MKEQQELELLGHPKLENANKSSFDELFGYRERQLVPTQTEPPKSKFSFLNRDLSPVKPTEFLKGIESLRRNEPAKVFQGPGLAITE